MKSNLIKTSLFIAGILLLLGAIAYFGSTSKSSTEKNNVVFQPDSQQLNNSGSYANSSTTNATSEVDNPITRPSNLPPYQYSSSTCKTGSSEYTCLVNYYKTLVSNYGATKATSDIKQRATEDSLVLSLCHPLMHVIGRQASQSYKSVSEAFAHGDSYCWSGYQHGVMEGMVAKIGLPNLPHELNNVCADIPGKNSYTFDYYNCVHGLGHGIMALLEDEVFKSLKMCDNLNGDWEQQSCYSGIFMQNIIDSTKVADSGFISKYVKPEDPMYPCTAVETRYKSQCYLGQTSYALQVSSYNFTKVFGMCAAIAEPYRDICNQSMGRDIANQSSHEPTLTRDRCLIPNDSNDVTNCIIGAAKEIISYYHSDKQSLAFCQILNDKYKTNCITTTNSYYSNF